MGSALLVNKWGEVMYAFEPQATAPGELRTPASSRARKDWGNSSEVVKDGEGVRASTRTREAFHGKEMG